MIKLSMDFKCTYTFKVEDDNCIDAITIEIEDNSGCATVNVYGKDGNALVLDASVNLYGDSEDFKDVMPDAVIPYINAAIMKINAVEEVF